MRQQKHGKPSVSGEALWRFSLAFYARPAVAEALIALQDRGGCDVNLILFGLWRGLAHGHRLDNAELRVAEAAVAPLRRAVIEPLRRLRRAQSRLAATIGSSDTGDDRGAAAEANLALCLGGEAQSAEAEVLRRALGEFATRG